MIHPGLLQVGLHSVGACAPTWEWSGDFIRDTRPGVKQTLAFSNSSYETLGKSLHLSGLPFPHFQMFQIPWRVLEKFTLLCNHDSLLSFPTHQTTGHFGAFALAVPAAWSSLSWAPLNILNFSVKVTSSDRTSLTTR